MVAGALRCVSHDADALADRVGPDEHHQMEPNRASIFSTGSIASLASSGSIASAFSVGSIGSLASVGSIASIGSVAGILSTGGIGRILDKPVLEPLLQRVWQRLTSARG